ncbi:MAG: AMP-binding protein, partial [Kiloniellales bacterium]|nr:AMP-binding protein [Kiloniellales bacterium]
TRLVRHASVDSYDHSSLRHVIYAGSPMYREDQKLALRKLGKVIVQYYGLGEVTGNITVLPREEHSLDDAKMRVGTCGISRTCMEIAVKDEAGNILDTGQQGEICVRGPAVFAGYHENPEANAKALKDGWFRTGDLGKLDDQGYLYITGRASDMYISGGANVYPREAEELLLAHPKVQDIAILGIEDKDWGEVGVGVVVPAGAGREEPHTLEMELLAYLDGKLARYKHPKRIFFRKNLPTSGYGKVPKHMLRAELYESGTLKRGQSVPSIGEESE